MTQTQRRRQSTRASAPVLILGSGAWGLSTALHLLREGHKDITVFDRANQIPSPHSAAYDLNKIVRAEYEDGFYTEKALEAIAGWKQQPFSPYYHQTGYIVATTGKAPQKAIDHLEAALETVQQHPAFASSIVSLKSAKDFQDYAWQFQGPLNGFKGYFNRLAGYAHSANAMKACWEHLAQQGVKFVLGEQQGQVVKLLYDGRSSERRCTGIQTADGKTYSTNDHGTVIVALGAHAASLIPSLAPRIVARSWSVAHVQLTQSECDLLRGIPTTNVRDLGFFFEPDPATRLFKICPLGAGFTNPVEISEPGNTSKRTISLPPPVEEKITGSEDFIPASDELKLRRLLQEVFPWMADRPFVEKRLCWFADTRDSDFTIDFVPQTSQSVVVLTGDSGHGFKMMPVFGRWVVDLLNAGKQDEGRWQWKSNEGAEDWSADVSWRIGEPREWKDLMREKNRLQGPKL